MKHLKLFEEYYDGEDEVFSFVTRAYDVKKAWELIHENPENFDLSTMKISEIERWFGIPRYKEDGTKYFTAGVGINMDYAKEIPKDKLDEPGIFVVDGDFQFPIDGWHRAYRRWIDGEKTIKVYVIDKIEDVNKIKLN